MNKIVEPLMPKATAVWLVDNTTLSFKQIGDFCQLHVLQVQAIADGEAEAYTKGFNPVSAGQTTAESIKLCEEDATIRLILLADKDLNRKTAGSRYTSSKKRQSRPEGIAWLVKNYPDLTTAQIVRLLRTTSQTVESIRSGKYPRLKELVIQNPVALGLVSEVDLIKAISVMEKRLKKKGKKTDTSDSEDQETTETNENTLTEDTSFLAPKPTQPKF